MTFPRQPGVQSTSLALRARMGEPSKPTTDRSFPRPEAGRSKRAIVDASNVAHAGEKGARLATLLAVRDELREEGFEPILIADAALRHQIDDRAGYERLVDEGDVKQAPAGTDADYFILTFARELEAAIVSNDRFKDRIDKYPEVRDRIIRYMILAGEVVLERRNRKRI